MAKPRGGCGTRRVKHFCAHSSIPRGPFCEQELLELEKLSPDQSDFSSAQTGLPCCGENLVFPWGDFSWLSLKTVASHLMSGNQGSDLLDGSH